MLWINIFVVDFLFSLPFILFFPIVTGVGGRWKKGGWMDKGSSPAPRHTDLGPCPWNAVADSRGQTPPNVGRGAGKELDGQSFGTSMQFDTFGFTAAELACKQAEKEQQQRPSAIPGPVSDEIILPVTESIGVKLLLKMGWRHGHSIKDSNANSQYDARREACKAFLAFSSDDSKAQNLSLSRATLKVLQNGLLMMMFCHTKAHLMARLRGLRILGPITSPLPLLQMVGRRTQAHTHPMTLTSSPTFAA
ncbi:uncharacterized protein LOC122296431 isoform X2 [Carya illinoinensis]|uniref:uncharacterized protein LOC122296431 isoform X2 n=1 Tax=Carya illinoinensis TaxID=32201 RepID=UPI001C7281E0|nr:uncharacterized protein LOC122296431 isoform X2 [Carya illinoinensis]